MRLRNTDTLKNCNDALKIKRGEIFTLQSILIFKYICKAFF